MSEVAPKPDRPWVLVVAHPDDVAGALAVETQLAERGIPPIVSGPSTPSTFEASLAEARAAILLLGLSGVEEWTLPALEKRSVDPEFRVVVARLRGAVDGELPPRLASAPEVDLAEPDGIDRLVALVSRPRMPEQTPRLAPRVRTARENLLARGGELVTPHAFAIEIASIQPEIARGAGLDLTTTPFEGESPARPVDDWLREIHGLFLEEAFPALPAWSVLLGLGLLDAELRDHYRTLVFEQNLVAELPAPVAEYLTARGLALFEEREPPPPPGEPTPRPASPEETVPTHADNPAEVDELGREGLARVLARRIRDLRGRERGGFLIHVHAPWGMGKTSLLNFVRRELGPVSGDSWIVIDFNAWRHQRIAPPWWWLMTALYQQGRRELWEIDKPRAATFVLREWGWRLWIGWTRLAVLALAVGGAILVWQLGWVEALWGRDTELSTLTGFLVALAAILTPLVAIWATLRSAGRWLLTGSPRGARVFVDHTRDPMDAVKIHFGQLAQWLHYPVIVLVDDLDRCRSSYVVELLEGIQTLFRDRPVAYVVAADRDWLSDCYAAEYDAFVTAADEPGRPLGYLFLEKTFQMCVTLSPPPAELQTDFWGRIIQRGEPVDRGELEQERRSADAEFAALDTEDAIRVKLVEDPGATAAQRQARREAAAVRLATPELTREAEHALLAFAPLLDPNPRAMKRLVNAYGIARGIETLGGENLAAGREAQQQTALWTILALRWPRLADHLERHPEHVGEIAPGADAPDGVPERLRPLFADQRVVDVLDGKGDGIDARLDEDAVRRCSGQVQV